MRVPRPKSKPVHRQAEPSKKMEFFMVASHQLKAPLAIIQWCLQIAIESPELRGKDRDMVIKALNQASSMSQLITDMLHVFRLVGKSDPSSTFVLTKVNPVIDEVIAQHEVVAHRRSIHLVKGTIENLPAILVDPAYFKQAFINLIDNAIKYSPEGRTVTVSARAHKGHVEIVVKDQGIGMSDYDQAHLFTEFFRSEGAKEMTNEGTGLGLVLVKHIIETFGGSIQVESEVGKGSTFTVSVPVAK